ncbi:MAG: HNH endonuclease [Candidatus Brocadiaceae bacterium]|nr:HNH endonuclease [Candidatus Brocadiaceae bacterium]
MNDLSRFLSKVSVVDSGCHEWQSTLHRDGYGKFWYTKKQVQAHRVSYLLQVGEIPAGLWVLHKCDNRKCVNPEHLYLGDAKQNVRDKVERCKWWGRMKTPFEIVDACRKLYSEGWTQQKIADHYGIQQTQVSRYINLKQRINF